MMRLHKRLISVTAIIISFQMDEVRTGAASIYDHWVACGNQASVRYEIYDPNVSDWNSSSALKWTFAPTTLKGWTSTEVAAYSNPSDLKLRWSNGNMVVVSCASGGLATEASYPGGDMLWAQNVGGSYNPHSVELLPDHNVAVAASAGNFVRVYAASQGNRNGTYAEYSLSGAHAVLWDPHNNVLWALGTSSLVSLKVGGTAASPTLSQMSSVALPASGGHDLSPYWGDDNRMWVTTSLNVWIFQKMSGTFSYAPGSADRTAVKGCGDEPSGEIVQCQIDKTVCTLNTWCTPNVNFFKASGASDFTRTVNGAAFYKCRIFWPAYLPSYAINDFDHDGASDACLYCSTNYTWYIKLSSDGSTRSFQFGTNGDIPLLDSGRPNCADFDDDGNADAVVYNPSDSTWQVRFSSNGSIHTFQYGTNGDIPLMGGDFDGDGHPDAVVFRPSDGTWHIRYSSNGSSHAFQYGTNGDIPLLADYDLDGIPDTWLFRPSDGTWHVRFSSDGSGHSFQYGESGETPMIMSDIDGDGHVDVVVFRPSDGSWHVRYSSDGSSHPFQFGQSGDIPGMAAWNGPSHPDDYVLFRPFNATFYVLDSVTGATNSFQFETSADTPVY